MVLSALAFKVPAVTKPTSAIPPVPDPEILMVPVPTLTCSSISILNEQPQSALLLMRLSVLMKPAVGLTVMDLINSFCRGGEVDGP